MATGVGWARAADWRTLLVGVTLKPMMVALSAEALEMSPSEGSPTEAEMILTPASELPMEEMAPTTASTVPE